VGKGGVIAGRKAVVEASADGTEAVSVAVFTVRVRSVVLVVILPQHYLRQMFKKTAMFLLNIKAAHFLKQLSQKLVVKINTFSPDIWVLSSLKYSILKLVGTLV
jgi:hypothetical protein